MVNVQYSEFLETMSKIRFNFFYVYSVNIDNRDKQVKLTAFGLGHFYFTGFWFTEISFFRIRDFLNS